MFQKKKKKKKKKKKIYLKPLVATKIKKTLKFKSIVANNIFKFQDC